LNWADTPYGPDGSLVAVDMDGLRRDVREMGEGIAEHAFAMLDQGEFQLLEIVQVATTWHDLPMRGDVPINSRIGWEIRDRWGERIKQARQENVSIIEMKRMTDQYNRFHWMQKMLDEWYFPSPQEIADRRLAVHLQAIRVNDVLMVGLPGEAVVETSLWLRAHTAGTNLIAMTECNGDVGYMPTAEDMCGGGYEAMCGLIAENGETVLREAALELLGRVQ
jgi:hypothetical protein